MLEVEISELLDAELVVLELEVGYGPVLLEVEISEFLDAGLVVLELGVDGIFSPTDRLLCFSRTRV